jgi:hypothetical protein
VLEFSNARELVFWLTTCIKFVAALCPHLVVVSKFSLKDLEENRFFYALCIDMKRNRILSFRVFRMFF